MTTAEYLLPRTTIEFEVAPLGDTLVNTGDALHMGAIGTDVLLHHRFAVGPVVAAVPGPIAVALGEPETWSARVVAVDSDTEHRGRITKVRIAPYPTDPCGCTKNHGGWLIKPCAFHRAQRDQVPEVIDPYAAERAQTDANGSLNKRHDDRRAIDEAQR